LIQDGGQEVLGICDSAVFPNWVSGWLPYIDVEDYERSVSQIEAAGGRIHQAHLFFPDFIVRLTNGVNLVLEVKGMINEQQKAKFEATKRWCKAVSNWGKAGRWEFHVGKDPETVKLELKHWAGL